MEAWVVGNKSGLKALKKAIKRALKAKKLSGETAFAGDGEGYRVLVLPTYHRRQPYGCPPPLLRHEDSKGHPYYLVSPEDYREAMGVKPKP